MLEAVLEASSVVIVQFILILRIRILAAYLPEEWVELVLVVVFLEVVQNLNLLAVCL